MTKTELESKHLGELHALAAEAGIERYRMLPRAELIERLAGQGDATESKPRGRGERSGSERQRSKADGERPQRQRRERKPRQPREQGGRDSGREKRQRGGGGEERKREEAAKPATPKPEPSIAPATTPAATTPPPASRPKRKRRRRWGRRGRKGVRVHDLLMPAAPGRQAIVYAEGREACTALLRDLAAELADASNGGADPIALLIDPSPEELADWRREAPQAEIVAAGQARHAGDALAQAARRAGDGEDVVVLIDSLSRFAESYGDADEAKRLFDSGREASGTGSLTVVAAVERS